MSDIKEILKRLPSAAKAAVDQAAETRDMMEDAEYAKQSSRIIGDALKDGCDVLQLGNGDIVTSGMKLVETRYTWDENKGRMVKVSVNTQSIKPESEQH